jgi:hypothetical protein
MTLFNTRHVKTLFSPILLPLDLDKSHILIHLLSSLNMAPQISTDLHHENEGGKQTLGTWTAIWVNNKGVVMILLSEIAGSAMDAIVRFLQQGEYRIHPLQVSLLPLYGIKPIS